MGKNTQNNKINLLFLLALANLLAAFGGGAVLQRGIAEVAKQEGTFPERHEETIIAFMIGTVIGFILIVLMKKIKVKWLPKSRKASSLFSFTGALISLSMVLVFSIHKHDIQDKFDWHYIIFYILLSVLFSLLFVPRVLRSDIAAGDKSKIGWVEFCYSTGMVLGLLTWTSLAKNDALPEFEYVLYYNVGFQVLAGILDFCSSYLSFADARPSSSSDNKQPLPLNWGVYTKVTIACIALTISIQVISIEFRSAFGALPSSAILAAFYFGCAVAALMFSMITTKFELPHAAPKSSDGILIVNLFKKPIPFSRVSILAGLPLLLAVAINLYRFKLHCPNTQAKCTINYFEGQVMFVGFVLLVVISAFLFEWIALALLNFIGLQAKERNREGLVAASFGSMGIGAAVSIGFLSRPEDALTRHISWIVTLMVGIIIANLAVRSIIRSMRATPSIRY